MGLGYLGAYGGPGLGDEDNPYSTHFGPWHPAPYGIELAWRSTSLGITLYGVAQLDIFGKERSPNIVSRRLPDSAFKFCINAAGVAPFRIDLYPNAGAKIRIEAARASYEAGRKRPPFGLHVGRSASKVEVFDVRAFSRIEFVAHDAAIETMLADQSQATAAGTTEADTRARIHADLWTTHVEPVASYGANAEAAMIGPYMDVYAPRPSPLEPVPPKRLKRQWWSWKKS